MREPVQSGLDAPGDKIAWLLDDLRNVEGLRVGPREEIAVARLLAELFARRAVTTPRQLAPFLAPVLARTPDERERFARAFDRIFAAPSLPPAVRKALDVLAAAGAPIDAVDEARLAERLREPEWQEAAANPDKLRALLAPLASSQKAAAALEDVLNRPPPEPPPQFVLPSPRRLRQAAVALLAVLSTAGGVWLASRGSDSEQSPVAISSTKTDPGPEPPPQDTERADTQAAPSLLAREAIDEIVTASAAYSYAPTIDELASRLAPRFGWGPEGFASSLAEATGRARTTPLPLITDPTLLAELAHAAASMDSSGASFTFAEASQEAARATFELTPIPAPTLIEMEWPGPESGQSGGVVENLRDWLAGPPATDEEILRGLSLWAQRNQRVLSLRDAPWQPAARPSAPWLPYVLAFIPLLFAGIWIAHTRERRKAYLRRRAPRAAPSIRELVAAGLEERPQTAAIARASQMLQTWATREGDRLDIGRTIESSLQRGRFTPVPARLRAQPDYLVLIETSGRGDQEACRLRALVDELKKRLLHVTVYYFCAEPSWAYREAREGGAEDPFLSQPIAIEDLASRTHDHRLVIMSAGEALLDTVSGAPVRAALALRRWPTRALLTPTPTTAWGRREFELARALDLPIGRATEDGFLALPALLGLDSMDENAASADSVRTRGLPETLRTNRIGWVQDDPPGAADWPQVKRLLTSYLDPAAYDWLAACAIYPEIRWDLTLFLGLKLTGPGGGMLYREDRLAALTSLPWFRVGRMPDWLRVRLIAELAGQAEPIRKMLGELVQSGLDAAEQNSPVSAVSLPIAVGESGALREALDDQIFLDFLAKGQVTDLDIPLPEALAGKRDIALDASAGVALMIGLGFATITAMLTPRDGRVGMFDDAGASLAAPNGAWLPVLAALICTPLLLAIIDTTPLVSLWRRTRTSLAAFFFALWFAAAALTILGAAPFGLRIPMPEAWLATLAAIAAASVLIARLILRRLERLPSHPQRRIAYALDLAAKSLALAAFLGALLALLGWPSLITERLASDDLALAQGLCVVAGLAGVLCAWPQRTRVTLIVAVAMMVLTAAALASSQTQFATGLAAERAPGSSPETPPCTSNTTAGRCRRQRKPIGSGIAGAQRGKSTPLMRHGRALKERRHG